MIQDDTQIENYYRVIEIMILVYLCTKHSVSVFVSGKYKLNSKSYHNISLTWLNFNSSVDNLSPCHTRVASSRRLHGVQEKLRTPRCAQWDLLERRGIAVTSPWHLHWTPWGLLGRHAQSARRGSAFPWRSEWAPCERSGLAAATQ